MGLTAKDKQIAFLNATNAAATTYGALGERGAGFDVVVFEKIRDEIYSSFLARCHEFEDEPLGVVPDLATVSDIPTPAMQVYVEGTFAPEAPVTTAAPALAPLPDATQAAAGGKDEVWRHLFAHPSDYFDNRENKRQGIGNPRQPDFKAKSGAKTALWINSKDTPQWVRDQLS